MGWISGNYYLSQAEMENNALLVRDYFVQLNPPWTETAIAGMLGNMQSESTISPGRWENGIPYWRGYGLVQWTPYTNYSNWYGPGWENNGDAQCARIEYERATGIEWIPTSLYPGNWAWFCYNTHDTPSDLASAFLRDYERPTAEQIVATEPARRQQAEDWYTFLVGHPFHRPPPAWLLFKMAEYSRKRGGILGC